MKNNTEPSGYLSVTDNKWTVIYQGLPLCRDGTEANARAVAAQNKVQTDIVWDGNKGCFVLSE